MSTHYTLFFSVSSPNYHPYGHRPKARNWENDDEQNQHHPENTAYQTSFDDVTYGDLRPDDFDNNHPDTIHFRYDLPTH